MIKTNRVYIITECPYVGIFTSIIELSQELKKLGFELNYILPEKPRNRYGEFQREHERKLSKFGKVIHTKLRRKLFFIYGDVKILKKLFKMSNPGVVISYTEYAGKVCRILYKHKHIKQLYHSPNCVGVIRKKYISRFIEYIFERLLAKHVSAYLTCGSSEAYILNNKYNVPAEKIIFLPNFRTVKKIKKSKYKYQFIYAGRMVKEKGVYELLDALTILGLARKAIFVGDGRELENLKQCYPEVMFTGRVLPEKVFYYFSISKFFVSNSIIEGLPYSLIEAMAIGLVPIVSNVEGHRDLLVDGCNGFMYSEQIDLVNFLFKVHLMSDKDYQSMSKYAQRTAGNLAKLAKESIKINFKYYE